MSRKAQPKAVPVKEEDKSSFLDYARVDKIDLTQMSQEDNLLFKISQEFKIILVQPDNLSDSSLPGQIFNNHVIFA